MELSQSFRFIPTFPHSPDSFPAPLTAAHLTNPAPDDGAGRHQMLEVGPESEPNLSNAHSYARYQHVFPISVPNSLPAIPPTRAYHLQSVSGSCESSALLWLTGLPVNAVSLQPGIQLLPGPLVSCGGEDDDRMWETIIWAAVEATEYVYVLHDTLAVNTNNSWYLFWS